MPLPVVHDELFDGMVGGGPLVMEKLCQDILRDNPNVYRMLHAMSQEDQEERVMGALQMYYLLSRQAECDDLATNIA